MKSSKSKRDFRHKAKVRLPRDYPWKVLDQLFLDLGQSLTSEDQGVLRSIIRERNHERLISLSEAWGPQSISPVDIPRLDEFIAKYQLSALLKKYQFPSDKKSRRLAAKEKFLAAEQKCKQFNEIESSTLAFLTDADELAVFTYAVSFLQNLLGAELPEQSDLTHWSRHGPGANLDTSMRAISLYDKYKNWPYSCTRGALREARLAIQDDERWLGALESDYREKHGIEPWRILDQETFWSNVLRVVPGNRITFVPKNSQTDRSIAIEPAMNLYLQLGVDGYIRRRLKRWGVDLDDQRKNQKLAHDGSKFWTTDDPFVTIDLAAASDSVSLEVCRLLLPPQWYTYLIKLRSPVGELDGEIISYEKISSMGNGYTFALESAIFTALIYGVEKTVRGRFDRDEFAVYGDDLIVRRSSFPLLARMLNRCGFSLNHEKSFLQGPFRESCGADWFNGTSVRPVFLSSKPSLVTELWNDYNRLQRIIYLRLGTYQSKVCTLINHWIPPTCSQFCGPFDDEDFASYKHVPVPVSRYKNGLWVFNRLTVKFKRLKGENFLFRKLMHTLRPEQPKPVPWSPLTWGGIRLAAVGGRFTIYRINSVIVSQTSSLASYWQDEYNDITPFEESNPQRT